MVWVVLTIIFSASTVAACLWAWWQYCTTNALRVVQRKILLKLTRKTWNDQMVKLEDVHSRVEHCPVCGWETVPDRFNDYVIRCARHDVVFYIVLADGGYELIPNFYGEKL